MVYSKSGMIYILIPSFNDSSNFQILFSRISKELEKEKFKYQIVLVDDGSVDETVKVINVLSKRYHVKRIGYSQNRGPGFAFKFGFKFLMPKIKDDDLVVTMEADNSSDFSILLKMIKLTQNYDVILSSPFAAGGQFLGLDSRRKFLSDISRHIDSIVFNLRGVATYSSFYRVYRGEILKKAENYYKSRVITEDGFSAVVELLIKLSKLDARLCEVPAVLDWRKRKGKSKMKIGRTIFNHLLLYINYYKGKYNHE